MKLKLSSYFFLILLGVAISSFVFAQNLPIQKEMRWENQPEEYKITKDSIVIVAGEHTDIYHSLDGRHIINNSARLLFKADDNFIFNAKVKVDFNTKWNAGVLFLQADSSNWAKLCFEKDYKGDHRIVSVVNKSISDDCNSDVIPSDEVYLQIVKDESAFYLYYSKSGNDWYLIRSFQLGDGESYEIGFMAQSPVGDGCRVDFADISYHSKKVRNFWNGE